MTAPAPAVRDVWFGTWRCNCSVLALTLGEVTATCPDHGAHLIASAELVRDVDTACPLGIVNHTAETQRFQDAVRAEFGPDRQLMPAVADGLNLSEAGETIRRALGMAGLDWLDLERWTEVRFTGWLVTRAGQRYYFPTVTTSRRWQLPPS